MQGEKYNDSVEEKKMLEAVVKKKYSWVSIMSESQEIKTGHGQNRGGNRNC